jgi:hypothetical protein
MANFPSNPSNGNTHTIGNTIWVYTSSTDSWTIQDVNEYAVANLESSLPSNPVQGTLWFDKQTSGRLFIYVDGHWIDASPASFDTVIGGSQIDVVTSGSGADVVVGHSNTSNLNGTYGSTGDLTKIDQITVDANGHVTAVTTGPIGHSNTSSLNGTYGSTNNGTKIDRITVDANGHVTAVTTGPLPSLSAGSGVGEIGVGVPTVSGTGTVTHLPGNNYNNVQIGFSSVGTWKCLSRGVKSQTFHYNDEAYVSINYMYYGLYQRVS